MDEWLKQALYAMPAALVVFDADDRMVICNAAYKAHFHPFEDRVTPGVSLESLLWLRVNERLDAHAANSGAEFVEAELESHRRFTPVEEWVDDKGRHLRRLRTRLPGGGTVGMRFDITDLREAEFDLKAQKAALEAAQTDLQRLAMTDALTGLTNRRASEQKLAEMMEAGHHSGVPVSVIAADLDGFKQVNDRYGHAAGDAVLRAISERFMEICGPHDVVARIGGDEFIFVLGQAMSQHEVEAFAKAIIAAVAEPLECDGRACRLGVSLGIALQRGAEDTPDDLMSFADLALYQSKAAGRNRYTVYEHTLSESSEMHARLSLDLLQAIEREELVVFLQPIISADNQQIVSAEALVRWQHPELGLLGPGEFLDIAEEMKISRDLDFYVLEKACRFGQSAADPKSFPTVSVNLSQATLQDPGFLNDLAKLEIPPGCIAFEILESVYSDTPDDQMRWTLDTLRERGFELALDDFGTGRSSINSVIQLQPDRLKIDRSFTQNIVDDEKAREIVRLTVALSHALGASVTAEGVETVEQAILLRQLGCDKLQGYLYGRPMPLLLFHRHLAEAPMLQTQLA